MGYKAAIAVSGDLRGTPPKGLPERKKWNERNTQERCDTQRADHASPAEDGKTVCNALSVKLSNDDFLEDIGGASPPRADILGVRTNVR